MKFEEQLRLQAFLDGELSPNEAGQVSVQTEHDPAAQALLAQLRSVRVQLRQAAPAVPVPASREFYWSRIAQEIGRQPQPSPIRPEPEAWSGWLRLILPASAMAVLAIFLALNVNYGTETMQVDAAAEIPAVETALASTDATTYRDASEGTTLVWFTDSSSEGLADAIKASDPN